MGIPVQIVGQGFDWSVLAAWTQALLSVLAVWFAGRFVVREHLLERERRIEAVCGVITVATQLLDEAAESIRDASYGALSLDFARERFTRAKRNLSELPLLEMGSISLIQLVDQAQQLVDLAERRFLDALENPMFDPDQAWAEVYQHSQAMNAIDMKVCALLTAAQGRSRAWWWRA